MTRSRNTILPLFVLLSLVLLILTQAVVEAKRVSCKNRFVRKMTHEYCSKFGVASHASVQVIVRSKLQNAGGLTNSIGAEDVLIEIGIFKDQDYEQLQAMESPTCEDYKKLASAAMEIQLPVDGTWSDKYPARKVMQNRVQIFSINRPRIYYVEVLDCENELLRVFNTGQFPRLVHKVHFTTEKGKNEFSYEDQGLLQLHFVLFLFLGALYCLMIRAFGKFYRTEHTWAAPHPIIIVGLTFQVSAVFFQTLHLLSYSDNGEGSTLCDVLSKILQSFSEVTISLLLITLASGWKLRYQEVDLDDGLEIYLPMTALVLMIQIILAALTFVDLDASHKYHDFAGIQGWCLVTLKTILFAYFYYCIYDSQLQAKKNAAQQQYLRSLLAMGASYLLAVPVTVIVTFLFEPYERQYTYTLLSEMAMFASNATMFYLLSNTKSSYRKASTDDAGLPHMM